MVAGPLRYMSPRLVEHEPAGWWSRLILRGKAAIPPTGVSIEGELAPPANNLKRAIERYERLQRKHGRVISLDQVATGGDRPFFEFQGKAAEAAAAGAYWVACIRDTTAVLLVGSITHVLGGPTSESDRHLLSPSFDPAGAARALLEGEQSAQDLWRDEDPHGESERRRVFADLRERQQLRVEHRRLPGGTEGRYVYDYVWTEVMNNSLRTMPFESLRTLRGIAENKGLRYLADPGYESWVRKRTDSSHLTDVSVLVLGVPLYVEVA